MRPITLDSYPIDLFLYACQYVGVACEETIGPGDAPIVVVLRWSREAYDACGYRHGTENYTARLDVVPCDASDVSPGIRPYVVVDPDRAEVEVDAPDAWQGDHDDDCPVSDDDDCNCEPNSYEPPDDGFSRQEYDALLASILAVPVGAVYHPGVDDVPGEEVTRRTPGGCWTIGRVPDRRSVRVFGHGPGSQAVVFDPGERAEGDTVRNNLCMAVAYARTLAPHDGRGSVVVQRDAQWWRVGTPVPAWIDDVPGEERLSSGEET